MYTPPRKYVIKSTIFSYFNIAMKVAFITGILSCRFPLGKLWQFTDLKKGNIGIIPPILSIPVRSR